MLLNPENLKYVSLSNTESLMCLTQQLINSNQVLVKTTLPEKLIEKKLPTEIIIDLDVDPTKIGPLFKGTT